MAKTVHITFAHPSPIDIWLLLRTAWAHISQALRRDTALLAACAEFRRCQATLAATPYEDEQGTDAAFAARKLASRPCGRSTSRNRPRPAGEGRRGRDAVAGGASLAAGERGDVRVGGA